MIKKEIIRIFLSAVFLLCIPVLNTSVLNTSLFAQSDSVRIKGDTVDVDDDISIEMLIENETEDSEDSELLDRLLKLKDNPVDLNSANSSELQSIPFIDAILATKIIEYRLKNKKFYSIIELRYVDGLDDVLYSKIKRFVVVKNSQVDFTRDEFGVVKKIKDTRKGFFSDFHAEVRSRFSNDLQPSAGYLDNTYTGSRPKLYNRIFTRYSSKGYNFTGSLLAEKDPGEKSFADHIGGYAEIQMPFILNQVLLGDYTLEFGQGITLWGSYSFSKGSEAVSGKKKKDQGVNSYSSVNEIQYFRGVAGKVKLPTSLGDFSLYGFYSNNNIDASIDTTIDQLSSLYEDGYHRTESEINRDDSGKEKLLGGRFLYETKTFGSTKIGLTYYKSEYSKPFKYKGIFDFSGTASNGLGVDYDIVFKNLNFFGEWARSYTDVVGGIAGLKILFLKQADLIFIVRNYPANFIMLHSYGFGEQSGISQNEFGIYSGIKFRIGKLAAINAYYDQYKFPYATFYNPVPTKGNDFLLYTEWNITRNFKLSTKYKNETKEETGVESNQYGLEEDKIFNRQQTNYRLQFDYDVFNTFRIRSRFEYVFVDYDAMAISQKGILFFSDFRVKPFRNIILDGRFIIFQTDSYDSRIYEFENEINGVVSNLGLYGKGRRWYLLLKYKPYNFLELSARYSETITEGAKSTGSGNDEILGDLKNRFSMQLEIKF